MQSTLTDYILIGGCLMISSSIKLSDDIALPVPVISHNLVLIVWAVDLSIWLHSDLTQFWWIGVRKSRPSKNLVLSGKTITPNKQCVATRSAIWANPSRLTIQLYQKTGLTFQIAITQLRSNATVHETGLKPVLFLLLLCIKLIVF